MNAEPLYYKQPDGTFKASENIWICGKCRNVAFIWNQNHKGVATKEDAEKCCTTPKCECGNHFKDPWQLKCDECLKKDHIKRDHDLEIKRFNEATKIDFKDYKEEYCFDTDGNFITDLDSYLEENPDTEYLYVAKRKYFPEYSLRSFQQDFEEHLDDWYSEDGEILIDIDYSELENAFIRFNKSNKDLFCYDQDVKNVVIFGGNDEN